jgi:lysophospholipase L1-like esterase
MTIRYASLVSVLLISCLGVMLAAGPLRAQQSELSLDQGDRICIIGNTLAERMQHDGWLETLMQAGLQKDLVFRNLGFSADTLAIRLRSKDFGTPDEWLGRLRADVVFAFFGYNESFAGESGLAAFEKQLSDFIRHTRSQKYNGDSAPLLVLFSPIACEDLRDKQPRGPQEGIAAVNPHLPDFAETNQRLRRYTESMQRIAAEHEVPVVDLFTPTLRAWESGDQYTINGVHLNENGNAVVAEIIFRELFGKADFGDPQRLMNIREAVRDKNWHWFHRYRTTDGYSTYGGRADLKFTDGQTNREVVQRELEVLDYMTAQRDRKIHALVAGRDFAVDDSQAPPFIPVITNKPGAGPDGTHLFLSGAEAIDKMQVHEGMQVNLFASEEQFPELASPVQMSFDTRGRLWVAAWPTYPHWQPIVEEMNDKLLIFSDTDGDGRADDMKVFADRLHNPTGFEFWNGGVLVAQVPDLWFLKDTDGDDVADVRLRVLHGID